MAVSKTTSKNSISMKLNTGVSASGSIKTKSVNLGTLTTADLTNDQLTKAGNIINALSPCLEYDIYEVLFTTTSILTF